MIKISKSIYSNVLFERATHLFNSGKVDEAIGTLENLVKIDSTNPDVFNNLGVFYHSLKNDVMAVNAFSEGLRVDGDNLQLKTNLADLYLETGKENHAINLLEQIVSTSLNHENAALKLVSLYHYQKLDGEIKKIWNLINTEMPASEEKEELLTNITFLLEDLTKQNPGVHNLNEDSYEDIPCPYCNEDQAETFRKSADIVKCNNCDTVYLRHRQKVEEMYKLYQSYAEGDSHMAIPNSDEEIKKSPLRRDYFLKEIMEFTNPTGILLDIGCGWGAFLYNARLNGFIPRGIEMTKKCVEYANKTLSIEVTNDQFEDTPFAAESISVITMNHVFEHLPFPLKALKKVHQILIDGGLFCGMVPNISSYLSRELKDEWYWLDPNFHYVHYSPETLTRHFENNGFTVEKMYTATGDYGRQNVVKGIKKFVDVEDKEAERMVTQLEQNLLGEEIRFIARKK